LQTIDDNDPITTDEIEILLNETIAGIPVPKQMSQTMNKQDDLMAISLMICRMI
jgi:hypothetical protein